MGRIVSTGESLKYLHRKRESLEMHHQAHGPLSWCFIIHMSPYPKRLSLDNTSYGCPIYRAPAAKLLGKETILTPVQTESS